MLPYFEGCCVFLSCRGPTLFPSGVFERRSSIGQDQPCGTRSKLPSSGYVGVARTTSPCKSSGLQYNTPTAICTPKWPPSTSSAQHSVGVLVWEGGVKKDAPAKQRQRTLKSQNVGGSSDVGSLYIFVGPFSIRGVHEFAPNWEVLNGVGVDGVGEISHFFRFFFFSFFLRFLRFLLFSFFLLRSFFVFLCFSGILLGDKGNNCNSLQKWGISLRPRLH